MSQENAILCGNFEDVAWIRVEGKGSFLLSPLLKECAEIRQRRGESRFVIDLQGCTGMDSTFMGYLASLGSRMMKQGGWVAVAEPGERNRRSLEDLGLDCLLRISPGNPEWEGRIDEIRGKLKPFTGKVSTDIKARTMHVLQSHQMLAQTSEENARKFEDVLRVMEAESERGNGASQ